MSKKTNKMDSYPYTQGRKRQQIKNNLQFNQLISAMLVTLVIAYIITKVVDSIFN